MPYSRPLGILILGKALSKVKDDIPMEDQGSLVYKSSCNNCDAVYVGETSHALADRMREHRGLTHKIPKNMADFENLERSSAIALHAIEHS